RGADVQADPPGNLELKVVDGVDELLAAAAHEGGFPLQLYLGRRGHEGAGLVDALAVHEHVARQDVPGGLFSALHQPFVDEQPVNSNARWSTLHSALIVGVISRSL